MYIAARCTAVHACAKALTVHNHTHTWHRKQLNVVAAVAAHHDTRLWQARPRLQLQARKEGQSKSLSF